MATTITIACDETSEAAVFPGRCVGCGGASRTASALAFSKVVTNARGSQAPVHVTLAVPHCDACARTTKSVFLVALIPFVLGFLGVGIATFVVVGVGAAALGLDGVGRPNNANSLVVGAAAGLVGGIAGGFVFEVLARVVLLPVFGRALLQAPLFVPSLFTDADHVAGLTGRPSGDLTAVALTFTRDDIAQECATSNAARLRA